MGNVRNRLGVEFFKKDDIKNNVKQRSKLTFDGIHQSFENCDTLLNKMNFFWINQFMLVLLY